MPSIPNMVPASFCSYGGSLPTTAELLTADDSRPYFPMNGKAFAAAAKASIAITAASVRPVE
jgi:hypothetical protein